MHTLAESEVVVDCAALDNTDGPLFNDAINALMTLLLNQSSNRKMHPLAVLRLTAEIVTINNGI